MSPSTVADSALGSARGPDDLSWEAARAKTPCPTPRSGSKRMPAISAESEFGKAKRVREQSIRELATGKTDTIRTSSPWCCRAAERWGLSGRRLEGRTRGHRAPNWLAEFRSAPFIAPSSPARLKATTRCKAARILGDHMCLVDSFEWPAGEGLAKCPALAFDHYYFFGRFAKR